MGAGARIDIVFATIRLALAWNDLKLLKVNIEKARSLVEAGGDWDRRNRLSIYDATYLMMTRQFKEAAELLLKSTNTYLNYPDQTKFPKPDSTNQFE